MGNDDAVRPPNQIRHNQIQTAEDWAEQRRRARVDPGTFHGDIAKQELHWYLPCDGAWATFDSDAETWTGFDDGRPVELDHDAAYEPWDVAFDDSDPPMYRWFTGGLTNACFNEVDRHVLDGHGDEVAYYFEGDRWDQLKNDGHGGPIVSESISRRDLLWNVVVAASVLANLGVEKGDRVALNMPNTPEQIYYIEACKRLGVIYTPVFGGFSDKTLSDRIASLGADVLVTADGGYRNAEVVPYKEAYSDPALDNYLPTETVLEVVSTTLSALDLVDTQTATIRESVESAIEGEITVDRADAMWGVGHALESSSLSPERASTVRTELAQALVRADRLVDVVVVEHTGQEIQLYERDSWAHELESGASDRILANARDAGFDVETQDDMRALSDRSFVEAVWATSEPEPVDAEYPMFVIYTSGSTGKPKGIVHVHGGYTAGIAHTMAISFDIVPGEDTIFVVADPGWITGQSYLISASLTTRTTGVIAEGSPVYPDAGRFTSIIERYGVTVFKAGVTFLKTIMEDEENVIDMNSWSTDSLRVATFCAEPVSPAVQQFGMETVCERYINSYWATEHGGIVWTHFFGNEDFELRPNGRTYPCPWVFGDVWRKEETKDGVRFDAAAKGERGEIIIQEPYPYLLRTVWGDLAGWNPENLTDWVGDRERFEETYWVEKDGELAYLQGDVARQYEDGSFSLHGRSDEVINVSGHRMGTEELEGAMLRDKQLNPDSPVANVIVLGAPHHQKGLVPVAFVQTREGTELTTEVERRLAQLVREEKGAVAVPDSFIEVEAFPETRSGKYVRRMLSAMLAGDDIGDTTSLKNPDVIESTRPKAERWRRRQRIAREQDVLDEYRFFVVQYNTVPDADTDVATIIIDNPPVNALTERALDELNTIAAHLDRREDIGVVIVASESATFVAGADIEQFLDEVHETETARTLATKAHEAFRKLETLSVPVVAAVNGAALGGGNELQLATHYTIADRHAEFGQPELRLNLIPGYGGTQRLPRILADTYGQTGLVDAVTIVTNGRSVEASAASAMGLVDEVAVDTTARARAAALARQHVRGESTTLRDAREDRQIARERWRDPGEFDESVIDHEDVIRNRHQCEHASVGRETAFERAVDAIRTGFEDGIEAGYRTEADNFGAAVVDPVGGKTGIKKFLDKQSEPLPLHPRDVPSIDEADALVEQGDAIPIGEPFYPGVDTVPNWQFGFGVEKVSETGAPSHGEPIDAEVEGIYPVEKPGPNEVLLYMLASEVNFNDIWAVTGIPVSQFDNHDQDRHITGSGGVGLVVEQGSAVREQGRVQVGHLVTVYSGQSDLLSPEMGLDPMYAGFSIQGYEEPDGSHQQFMVAQGPQVHPIPAEATLEEAGSYVLGLGTVYRALFTTLDIESDTTMFVEGGATGTGWESVRTAIRNGVSVTGLCSSTERADRITSAGAHAIDRTESPHDDIWGPIPRDPEAWDGWKEAGQSFVEAIEARHGTRADYAVSHAGEQSFPRTFQTLGKNGKLTFWGASTGYQMTFLGKPGTSTPEKMFDQVDLRAGDGVLVYYGSETGPEGVLDEVGLRTIEAARDDDATVVVVTNTEEQCEFVESLGYGDAVTGSYSIEGLEHREDEFNWPETMPELPHPQAAPEAFKQAVQRYTDTAFKPLGKAIGKHFQTLENPRGYPDVVFERAGQDTLGVSTMLVKPHTGRVVYSENLEDQRYSFYAPQVWMRQREIHMPTASILGSHLSNAYEVQQLNASVDAGALDITTPELVVWDDLPDIHQAMWDNEHEAEAYVVNHALPTDGLRTRQELFKAWGRRD